MIVVTLHCKEVASGGRCVAPTGGGSFMRLEDRPLLYEPLPGSVSYSCR